MNGHLLKNIFGYGGLGGLCVGGLSGIFMALSREVLALFV